MFISSYTPSRLQIWRNYSNQGFPVSQQIAVKYLTNQGASCPVPLFDVINGQVYGLTTGATATPLRISSNNGQTFPIIPVLPIIQTWRGVAGSPTRIIATGGTNTTDIAFSDDNGVTFFSSTVLSPADWGLSAYGNGRFVITANNSNAISVSTDNAASFVIQAATIGAAGNIRFLNGFFYRFTGTLCERSATGLTGSWTTCKYDGNLNFGSNSPLCFIYAANKWVCAFGNLLLISSDGLNFVSVRLPIAYTPTAIVYANNNFILLSANVSNVILTTSDLSWFTQRVNIDAIAMLDGLMAANGVALLRDNTTFLRTVDTLAYEVSYV